MSDKPEDIPQWAWDASEKLIVALEEHHVDFTNDGRIQPAYQEKQYDVTQSIISRVILQASVEAFAGASEIARREAERVRDRSEGPHQASKISTEQAWLMCADTAGIIASAIRQSSTKGGKSGKELPWLSMDDAETELWQAIQGITIGSPTDDKLILDNLQKRGVWLARYEPSQAIRQHSQKGESE